MTSVATYLLWFEYSYILDEVFKHTFFASTSYFVGCLLGGILLAKMSTSRIKSSKGKISNLKCVFITMYSISLFGSIILIFIHKYEVPLQYEEVIIFIVQCGISSAYVTINVAVIILITVNHRAKIFAFLSTINAASIGFQPAYSSYFEPGVPTYTLIAFSATGIFLTFFISSKKAQASNDRDSLYT